MHAHIFSRNEIKSKKRERKKLNHRRCLRFYFEIVCGSVFMFILVLLYCVSISSFSRTCSLYCFSYAPIHTLATTTAAAVAAESLVLFCYIHFFLYIFLFAFFCSCDSLKLLFACDRLVSFVC